MKKILSLIIAFMIFFLCACTYSFSERRMLKEIKSTQEVDLSNYIKTDFDYLIILNQGITLRSIENPCTEKNWLGEKIIFFKDDSIVSQINIDYYVSDPENKNYISFFQCASSWENPYIYREKNDSKFSVIYKQKLSSDFFCYYLN